MISLAVWLVGVDRGIERCLRVAWSLGASEALETCGRAVLRDVDWRNVRIVIGGAAVTLPHRGRWRSARIAARRPCLCSDEALAIGLYARAEALRC